MFTVNVECPYDMQMSSNIELCYVRGGFIGGGAPGQAPLFLVVKIFTALYLPLCQHFSSYVDVKCVFCLCMTVKIQFDNNRTCKYSSYSPSPRSLYAPTRVWARPIQKF